MGTNLVIGMKFLPQIHSKVDPFKKVITGANYNVTEGNSMKFRWNIIEKGVKSK